MMPNVKRGVSAVRARNSTLPIRCPWPGGMTIGATTPEMASVDPRAGPQVTVQRGEREGKAGRVGRDPERDEGRAADGVVAHADRDPLGDARGGESAHVRERALRGGRRDDVGRRAAAAA